RSSRPSGGFRRVVRPERGRQELDLEPLDARAAGLEHAEADLVLRDLVTDLGRAAEMPEHEPRDRVEVLSFQTCPELLVEVVDRERPVDPDRRLAQPLDQLVREIELVLDVADDLLEQVLEGDDAGGGPVLVHDDGDVLTRPPEVREEGAEVLRLGNDVRSAQEVRERDGASATVVERGDEVTDVEDPDDVVERLSVD